MNKQIQFRPPPPSIYEFCILASSLADVGQDAVKVEFMDHCNLRFVPVLWNLGKSDKFQTQQFQKLWGNAHLLAKAVTISTTVIDTQELADLIDGPDFRCD